MRQLLILSGLLVLGCQAAATDDPPPPRPEVPRPAIGSISPSTAASTGGEMLIIRGAGFSPRASVSIAGVAADQVTWISPEQLSAQAPARLGVHGRVPVAITNPDGGADLREDMFSYFAGVVQFHQNQDYPAGVSPIAMQLLDVNDD